MLGLSCTETSGGTVKLRDIGRWPSKRDMRRRRAGAVETEDPLEDCLHGGVMMMDGLEMGIGGDDD